MFWPRDCAVVCILAALCLVLSGCGGGGSSASASSPAQIQLSVKAAGAGAGVVSSSPGGINCGSSCTANFSSGTQVTLTASAMANSFFSGWSGACSGSGTCTMTLTTNESVTATFSDSPVLTVSRSGTGQGTVTSNPSGINCGSTCSASFNPATQVTLTATPGANSTFAAWAGACSGSNPTCTVTLNASQQVTAIFDVAQNNPTLSVVISGNGSVASNPGGINCPSTCNANFKSGTLVTLIETPAAGSYFVGWSGGGCSGSNPTCSLTLTANQQVTATFNVTQSNPTLTVVISGNGSVTSNPAGISCPSKCSASFKSGTLVTLTETPAAGSYFVGWSGGGCSGSNSTCNLTLTSSQQVTATFNVTQSNPTLSVALPGTGSGSVSSSPPGISCPTTCSATFSGGTQVTLTETPASGSYFAGWSGGGCSGTSSTCVLTLNASEQVNATFTLSQGLNSINHIIYMAQENRSFDHYFGTLRAYWKANGIADQSLDGLPQFNPTSGPPPLYGPPPTNPGCDPAFQGCKIDANSPQIQSYKFITECIENPGDEWSASLRDRNRADPLSADATLDGFVLESAVYARTVGFYDTDGIRSMGYHDSTDLNYYYFMATAFATSDRWFSPVMTRTPVNRNYLDGATSMGHVHTLQKKDPPLSAPPIFEALQNAGITWKIYVNPGNVCTGPPYDPACLLTLSSIQTFAFGQTIPTKYPNNIAPISQYFTDLQNGTLPQVGEIEEASDVGLDEHPSDYDSAPTNIQSGAKYVSSLINGLMGSSSWQDSAFILTYDEFGGLYDHVPPQPTVSPDGIKPLDLRPNDVCYPPQTGPVCDFVYTGYRMPLIVVSPFTKQNYVSHTVADTTAILKFIETRYGLQPLNNRDAAQMDMTEFFDFDDPPWLTPPTPPAQATNGPCYINKVP